MLAARLLRRRDARHRRRRDGAETPRRAGLCAARDRAQQIRRRLAEGQGRGVRRGAGRGAGRRRAGGVLRPRRAEIGAGEARARAASITIDATCPLVTKVHREAQRAFQARPPDHPDRPCRPSRGGRHAWANCRQARSRWSERARMSRALDLRRRAASSPIVTQTTLSVDDTRDVDRGAASGASPRIQGPPRRGHLLRHHQPPGGGQGGRARGRRGDRRRRRQFLEFAAAARSRRARGLQGRAARPRASRRSTWRALDGVALARRSPPAPRRRRSWSSRSSTASPSAIDDRRWRR